MVNGYWLLVIGYWLLVIGYWLLVIGYWLLVIGYDGQLSSWGCKRPRGAIQPAARRGRGVGATTSNLLS